jgi:rubredoxin
MSQPKPSSALHTASNANAPSQKNYTKGKEGIPNRSRTVGGDRFHTTQTPAGYAELLPVDLGAGSFTAGELEKRHTAREAAHNAAVAARHTDRLGTKPVNSHNTESPAGDSGRIDSRSDGSQPIRSNAKGPVKETSYQPSSGPNVTQAAPGRPWSSVPAGSFSPRQGATSKANKK